MTSSSKRRRCAATAAWCSTAQTTHLLMMMAMMTKGIFVIKLITETTNSVPLSDELTSTIITVTVKM